VDCTEVIQRTVENLEQGFKCLKYEERLCIVTPYLYPDNDLIEVFVEAVDTRRVRVTDLGETLRHLESLGLDLYASRKRKFLLDQVSRRLHVDVHRGKLTKEGLVDEVGHFITDVAAAAHTIADLIYTSKAYEPATFPEEVSMFLNENEVEHERNYRVFGETGHRYSVSLRINGRRTVDILVEVLSPHQETAITSTVNRALRKWFDISEKRNKVSLFNDIDFSWREEDKVLLEKVSVIHMWSNKDKFLEYVK